MNMKYALMQMQYRFAVIYETPSTSTLNAHFLIWMHGKQSTFYTYLLLYRDLELGLGHLSHAEEDGDGNEKLHHSKENKTKS